MRPMLALAVLLFVVSAVMLVFGGTQYSVIWFAAIAVGFALLVIDRAQARRVGR